MTWMSLLIGPLKSKGSTCTAALSTAPSSAEDDVCCVCSGFFCKSSKRSIFPPSNWWNQSEHNSMSLLLILRSNYNMIYLLFATCGVPGESHPLHVPGCEIVLN